MSPELARAPAASPAPPQPSVAKGEEPKAPRPRTARTHEEAVELIVANGGRLFRGNNLFTTPAAVRAARDRCWLTLASGEYDRVVWAGSSPERGRGAVAEPFTDEDLDAVGLLEVDWLDWVHLIGQHVTDDGVGRLLDLPAARKATVLELTNCRRVGDDTFRRAAELPLCALDADGTGVTDAGVAHLVGGVALRKPHHRLSLRGTKVTDAAIPDLERLAPLRQLDLRETGVTRAGYERLRRRFPSGLLW